VLGRKLPVPFYKLLFQWWVRSLHRLLFRPLHFSARPLFFCSQFLQYQSLNRPPLLIFKGTFVAGCVGFLPYFSESFLPIKPEEMSIPGFLAGSPCLLGRFFPLAGLLEWSSLWYRLTAARSLFSLPGYNPSERPEPMFIEEPMGLVTCPPFIMHRSGRTTEVPVSFSHCRSNFVEPRSRPRQRSFCLPSYQFFFVCKVFS